ncbi:hypothetical protein BJ684DRAFT_10515 [Piptocephalis cylindrospora]|uniref:NAD-dependent epimerase/dehydratase domain-containing protein n=1 Tax=Piptocephalis cylindrospora TaxID=1907219 RepID=A0A4P9Y2P9_9FUNG|nr:hypothetical protein BJ684DRAFT_10515 [Piptocephalis cylindrospora]|eukprot:RKP13115.1 hypothetical protein BJ684DRAFT_10515 [Piptocephalis cylindrospora]
MSLSSDSTLNPTLNKDGIAVGKPTLRRVLILGGLSPDGREALVHLTTHSPSTYIRVVDKLHPGQLSIPSRQEAIIRGCDYHQANLLDAVARKAAFSLNDPEEQGAVWDAVWNFEAEERLGLVPQVYTRWVEEVSVRCAEEAAAVSTRLFLHVSTAMAYEESGKENTEVAPLSSTMPWVQAHIRAEESIRRIPNLPLVIVRPSITYGTDDTKFIAHLLVCGRIYQALGEPMYTFHPHSRQVNTVHTMDLAAASLHLSQWYLDKGATGCKVYNLSDPGRTTIEKLNDLVGNIFGICVKSQSWIMTKAMEFTRSGLENAMDEANEKHLGPWSKLLEESGVQHSPLTPYLDPEYFDVYEVAVDGQAIVRETGFQYQYPAVTEKVLKSLVEEWSSMGIWPKADVRASQVSRLA